MIPDDSWPDILAECCNIADETVDILLNMEQTVSEYDTITPVTLHNLYDMVYDVAEFNKIRRAEKRLAWRRHSA